MRNSTLGPFDRVSRLTLGGGGLGQGWGASSEDEAVATVHEAVAAGINLDRHRPDVRVVRSGDRRRLQRRTA